MGKIVAGIGTSHVPSIGIAYDKGEQNGDNAGIGSLGNRQDLE